MSIFTGTSSGDYLTAYTDGDVLVGLGGGDVFSTNGAWFRAEGGAGDDIFHVMSAETEVVELASDGIDTVWLYTLTAYTLPEHVENLAFFDEAGRDGTGNALANAITGNAAANRLTGLGGDDVLVGGGGGDRLDGGEGNDFLDAGGGAATIVTGAGRDTIYVNKDVVEGHYTVTDFDPAGDQIQVRGFWEYTLSQVGADTLVTFSPYVTVLLKNISPGQIGDANFDIAPVPGDHVFVGTDRTESMYGWADGDALYGLGGDDYFGDHDADWSVFHGGKGNDTFDVDNVEDQIVEIAGEGTDLVWLYLPGVFAYTLPDNVENINVMGAGTVIGNDLGNAIQGSGGDDVLLGGGGADTIRGNFGSDRIEGGDGGDLLDGGGGDSVILTGGGADRVFMQFGSGNHVVDDFSISADTIEVWDFTALQSVEQIGQDTLVTFWTGGDEENPATTSVLLSGVSAGDLHSGSFTFVHQGTGGSETISGGRYNDKISGAAGADVLNGAGGVDTLTGGSGADRLSGGQGADVLRGGGGDDILNGGMGRDLLTGGAGADWYQFRQAGESTMADPDRIYGFSRAEGDRIDLRAIDAISATAGDDGFRFIGRAAFSGTAGELRFARANGATTVYGDTDGNGTADFAIRLDGLVDLAASDFLI